MPWLQFTLCCDRKWAPLIEEILESSGTLAVTLRDAADDPQLEPPPGTSPLWSQVRLTGLFRDEPQVLSTIQALSQFLIPHLSAEPRLERIPDQVWERIWLDDFAPTCFGRRLWICPRGQSPDDPGAVVVELDPGLAFGTGHHPTTALCLRWLDGADLEGKTVIDYGCGSGILAIAALRIGATVAVAVDHDPQALEATRSNACQNAVADRLLLCTPEEVPEGQADILVANILAGPLVELAPRLAALVRPAGFIVLSGILDDQTAQIEGAYAPWFQLNMLRTQDEWVLLSGCRRRNPRPWQGDA